MSGDLPPNYSGDIVSPSAMKITKLGKVCLICSGVFDRPRKKMLLIYLVDLKEKPGTATDNEFINKQPTLMLESGKEWPIFALCVVGCQLFVFESCMDQYPSYDPLTRAAYTFDFSQVCDEFNILLSKNMMQPLPDMPYPMRNPIAIPTPDSENILVFPRSFSPILHENVEVDNFMLYHLSTFSWTPLPGIRHMLENAMTPSSFIYVDAYAFLSPHTFFIKTCPGQMFTLDLLSVGEEGNDWQPFESYIFVCDWYHFHVIQDTWFTCDSIFHVPKSGPKLNRGKQTCILCRFGFCGCDDDDDDDNDSDSDDDTNAPYFLLSHPEFCSSHRSYPITTLVDSGFCLVSTGVEINSKFPHIIVDVFDIDGDGVGEGVLHEPFTTLRFVHNASYDYFIPIGMFKADY